MNTAALAARVRAVNRANQFASTLYDTLREVFAPLVGTPILKVDGSLLKKVEDRLPKLPYDASLRVTRLSSHCSLGFVVTTCEDIPGTGTCLYHETTVYVGKLDGATLVELYQPPQTRPTYTAAEITRLRAVYADAKKVADAARDALHPFGECDR